MKYVLVVVFHFGSSDQPPQFVDGYLPSFHETEQECKERLRFAEDYLSKTVPVPYTLECYTVVPRGEPM